MKTLPEIERAMAAEGADHGAIAVALRELSEQFQLLRLDITIAVQHEEDLRPALARYVRGCAELNGRSPAEQIAAFCREEDPLFSEAAIRAWGIAFPS